MKLQEVLKRCDRLKPNQFEAAFKTEWVNELEGRVVDEVLRRSLDFQNYVFYPYTDGEDSELIVPDPYSRIYLDWLFCQIDYYNQELERYNNSAAMFNAGYAEFQAYFRRTHMPIQRAQVTDKSAGITLDVFTFQTVAGTELAAVFDRFGNRFVVKNFTDGDIYVAFSSPVAMEKSIRIRPGNYQIVMVGEKFDYQKTATDRIYILPEANSERGVEVQLLMA